MNPKLPQAIEVVDEAEQQGLANLRCQAAPRSARRKLVFDHRENSFHLGALPIVVPRKSPAFLISERLVRKGGFEPPRLTAPPPQDGASASSATSARGMNENLSNTPPRPAPWLRGRWRHGLSRWRWRSLRWRRRCGRRLRRCRLTRSRGWRRLGRRRQRNRWRAGVSRGGGRRPREMVKHGAAGGPG